MTSQGASIERSESNACRPTEEVNEDPCRTLVEHLPIAVVLADTCGRILAANPAAAAIQKMERSETFLGRSLVDIIAPIEQSRVRTIFEQSLRSGAVEPFESLVQGADGSCIPAELGVVVLRDTEGRPTALMAFAQDLSERKRAEKELLRLGAAIEQSGEAVVITDPEEKILYVNPTFEETTGYRKAEALGRTPRILHSGRHDAAFYRDMWEALQREGVWRGRCINRRRQGELFFGDTIITAVRDAEGRLVNYVGVQRDVTREVEIQSRLHQTQKLEAIGQLAGGLAHDFNNILAAMMMQLGTLQLHPSLDPEMQEALTDLEQQAQRAAALTRQMLLFSRRVAPAMEPLNLNRLIADLLKVPHRLARGNVSLQFDGSRDLPAVEADAGMVEQVLTNLVIHARDAMPGGGQVTIGTALEVLGELECRNHESRRVGRFVRLSVADSGPGMDEETGKHIFEPFYKIKEGSADSGLGLATAYGIVALHRGWMEVGSEPGRGTTFHVYLPASAQELSSRTRSAGAPAPSTGTETIFVVEDEPGVRRMLVGLLRRWGYRVQEAASGEEALNRWPAIEAEVDLLLTDVVMPGSVDGWKLAEHLRGRKPDLKVIITSGYSTEMLKVDQAIDLDMMYLAKPYTTTTLAQILRRCLDGDKGSPAVGCKGTGDDLPEGKSLRGEALRAIPAALAGQIHTAAVHGRYYRLLELLDQVEAADASVAARLRPLVRGFQYEPLIDLFGTNRP